MPNWDNRLRGDPLPWLLEQENPSVRCRTLMEILERPVGQPVGQPVGWPVGWSVGWSVGSPESDPDVKEARKAISRLPLVQELFALQHPGGYWGDDEAKPYTARGTLGVLSLLHMLGAQPDSRTAAGCDSFLRFSQHESGGFSMTRTRRSGIFPCTTGEHLPFLVYFGCGGDPRVRSAFAFLIEAMSGDRALRCGRYQHQDCLWGAIAALKGLAFLPVDMRSEKSAQVVTHLAKALLDARYDFEGEHKRWLTFGVPRAWDLISALGVLAAHGFSDDPRFEDLLQLMLTRQDEQGRWICGSVSRTWPVDRRNQPSKWVTLDALRVLKQTRSAC